MVGFMVDLMIRAWWFQGIEFVYKNQTIRQTENHFLIETSSLESF